MRPSIIALTILSTTALGIWGAAELAKNNGYESVSIEKKSPPISLTKPSQNTLAGNILISQFSQRQQQWDDAEIHLKEIKKTNLRIPALLKQDMILDLKNGDIKAAKKTAQEIINLDNEDEVSRTLAALIIIADNFKNQDYDQVAANIKTMPQSQLSTFIQPILKGWLAAGLGNYSITKLKTNLFFNFHAVYIADYLDKPEKAVELLQDMQRMQDLTPADIERIADIQTHLGLHDRAEKLYGGLLKLSPSSSRIKNKLTATQNSASTIFFSSLKSPADGMARAYYDMAHILFRDSADESARIFAILALSVNPDLHEAQILLASIASQYDLHDQAIAYFKQIPPSSPYFIETQRDIASNYEDLGQPDTAIKTLTKLFDDTNDINALIQIGDIQRRQSDFETAIETYNKAVTILKNDVPPEFWYLLYVRGMANEHVNEWPKAESDLKAALELKPDHPYILNYLGYAYADRGLNLDLAMDMITKAVESQPNDGFIIDSLGWVHFKLGHYEKSVPFLERAVELEPADPIINDHLGDAYWQVGRHIEARYQWQRAKGFTNSEADKDALDNKIKNGLRDIVTITNAPSAEPEKPASTQ